MAQTNLEMFLKEDTSECGVKAVFLSRPYIKEKTIMERRYQVDIAHAFSQNTQ